LKASKLERSPTMCIRILSSFFSISYPMMVEINSRYDTYMTANSEVLKELTEIANIIGFEIEKNDDNIRLYIVGDRTSLDAFKKTFELQLYYIDKSSEKLTKKKPKVQTTYNYNN